MSTVTFQKGCLRIYNAKNVLEEVYRSSSIIGFNISRSKTITIYISNHPSRRCEYVYCADAQILKETITTLDEALAHGEERSPPLQ